MSFDTQEDLLSKLHWILAERLPLSRTWNNVEVTVRRKVFEIRWVMPKTPDPKGKTTFLSRTLPLSKKSLEDELERQLEKYVEDRRV